jgi:hypothetical protein
MQTPTQLERAGTSAVRREIDKLRARMRGRVLEPGQAGYEEGRKIFNGMIDKRPRAIAQCEDVGDVVAAVACGREAGLDTAVRGGGHSAPGLGSCDGGLVIDLSRMGGVHVDPRTRRARVGGGAVWGAVDHAAHAFGLATPAGIISTTGVGGLTLGGGHGYLSRRFGLTIDNLRAAEVVLADGRVVVASEHEHPDLFWALRGGGGNFGVVTSFELALHPLHTVRAGPTFWSLDEAPAAMRWYDHFMREAPRTIYGFFAFLEVPPVEPFPQALRGRKVCGVMWCCLGDEAVAGRLAERVREPAEPILHHVGEMPYPELQRAFDGLYPPGLHSYWRGSFVYELPDAALAVHAEHGARLPTPLSTMHLYPVDGAVHEVASDATAFGYRDARWSQVIVGFDPDAAKAGALTRWTKDYSDALRPYGAEGAYVNFMMHEGAARIRATYRGNYDRLQRVKRMYDPWNFFRVNQNIDPAAPAALT